MRHSTQFTSGDRARPLLAGLVFLIATVDSLSIADASPEDESTTFRELPDPVPPLPSLDAPKRPFSEALLHLTLLEAEYFEEQLERLEAGIFDLGVYNEMYEFFRVESRRLSEAYPDEKFSYDSPELSEASARLTKARQVFQTNRFIAEQLENREKLGLDPSPDRGLTFEQRALILFRDYTNHYRASADRVLQAKPEKLEETFKGIRGEGLRMDRALRRIAADFPDQPAIFSGKFSDEPLGSASRELQSALKAYQAAQKHRAATWQFFKDERTHV